MLGVDAILIIIVSLVLSLVIVLYIALVLRFVLTKVQEKSIPDDPQTSFIERMSGWHPFRVANTKCVPIQPRTYDELKKSEEKLAETGSMTNSPEKTAGKIKLSLQYDSMRSTLMVTIHKVQLQETPSSGANDENCYVTLKILPQNHRSFQTKAVKKSKSLEFKERFEFRVVYEKLHAQSLKVTLCCFDRFSQHEPLGDHTVHLADLEARGLSLSREITLFRDIQTVQKATGVLGELMISLGYLRLTERLTVVVIRARSLKGIDDQTDPAAYVEVSLIHEGRILKQKKTHIKEPNRNPVFNETLTFHIPVGILHQTSFMLCVKSPVLNGTEDKLLGRVFLGPATTGSQFDHWNEMRINSKPIARWHKLLD